MKKKYQSTQPADLAIFGGILLTLSGCTNAILEPPTLALGLTTMALLLLRINKKK
ncbi:MAG: hypothetical protein HOI23_20225 [Deltaproteobacteria bacterium]|nr:hypothetical protein [Deltaproteobacteria bacterium]MBT6432757.1 hypothetical protein [Deltaproteobacteria bacterium]MBT6490394.1 hypothetical protein [Deltaproteobacteria bacterium]